MLQKLVDNRVTRRISARIVRRLVERTSTRALVNYCYNRLSDAQRAQFHSRFAKIFREGGRPASGSWNVHFAGHQIALPLRDDWYWLDWDTAVSIVGHDIEIKKIYRDLLASKAAPEIFVDIGANYGTHSLLFLAAEVPTLSFEPNEACFEYFDLCCRNNNLRPAWRATALGSSAGTASLSFPKRDTWLGSVTRHSPDHELVPVPMRTLDAYLPELAGKRVLIKIDTEGGELAVLQGARNILHRVSPMIIFESNSDQERSHIFWLLTEHGYRLAMLPYTGEQVPLPLESFLVSSASNFIAIAADWALGRSA